MTYESTRLVDPRDLKDENVAIRGGSFREGRLDASNGWLWLMRSVYDRDSHVGFRLALDP
jgi:hypothetical protein